MNHKQILSEGSTLAEFSNLGTGGVNRFRQKHPDFLPERWWEYRNGEQWQMTQGFLREAWQKKFDVEFFWRVLLLLSVFDPEDTLDGAFGFPVAPGKEQAFATLSEIPAGTTPFQRAVLHLFENPWRARFCPVCGNRFVAAEAKTKFCSQKCSEESTRKRHNEWARKNLKAWRKKQKTKKGGKKGG
jgi:hypothetical protein